MGFRQGWHRFVHNPQRARWRKVVLKLHLWTGIAAGLYIILISVTGSAAVFRRDLAQALLPGRAVSGPAPWPITLMEWCADLHDNLLAADTGRMVNGFGAMALAALMVTGALLWWPGRARWYLSLIVPRPSRTQRFFWHLHSALAVWGFVLLFAWAITGIYFAFPDPFNDLFDALTADPTSVSRTGEDILNIFIRMHFGRFGGWPIRITWAVLGLLPAVLFLTGFVVWWQRRKVHRTSGRRWPFAIGRAAVSPAAGPPASTATSVTPERPAV